MNIPSKVKIDGMDYKVIRTDEILTLDNRVCCGLIDYKMHWIKINNSEQDEQAQKQTLLHEIVHGIMRERNFDLQSEKEVFIDEMAKGFYQLIIDNPEMFKENEKVEDYPMGGARSAKEPIEICSDVNTKRNISSVNDDVCEYSITDVELVYGSIGATIETQCHAKNYKLWVEENETFEDVKERYEISYCAKCGRKVKLAELSKEISDKVDGFRTLLKNHAIEEAELKKKIAEEKAEHEARERAEKKNEK